MSRFLFRRLREDADDGSVEIMPNPDMAPWTCRVCSTTKGNAGWDRCVVCNREKGTWLCQCGHLNPAREKRCETCGRPK